MFDESQAAEETESLPEYEPTMSPPRATWREQGIVFLVMALVLLADHLSKAYVEDRFPLNSTWAPFPEWESLFRITHVSNTGAAFGLFQSGSTILSIVAVIVSVFIVIYNRHLPANMKWYRLALGLQLGGALGNLLSRMRLGHVTDFLDFGPVPVFNLADTSIVVGTILLGFLMIFYPPEEVAEASTQDEEQEDEDTVASKDQSLLLNE